MNASVIVLCTLLVHLTYGLNCGFGYSTMPPIDTSKHGLPPEGFIQTECKSANYCASISTALDSNQFLSLKLKFCSEEMGALGQIISTEMTCRSAINGENGCTKQTISSTLIPILPKNISVKFCCCGTDLCNCNNWNPLSPQYCSPVAYTSKPPLGWLTKQSNPTPQSPLPSPSKAHIVRLSTNLIFIFSTVFTVTFDCVFNRL